MDRAVLSDEQWRRISPLLPGRIGAVGVSALDNRTFLEAVLWIARTGAPWRDLPESFGPWSRTYVRFNRWGHKGVWANIFAVLAQDPDFEYVMIDSTIVRAHQHSAGGKGGRNNKPLGVLGVGCPQRFMLSSMQWETLSK
jgi:putative transposase